MRDVHANKAIHLKNPHFSRNVGPHGLIRLNLRHEKNHDELHNTINSLWLITCVPAMFTLSPVDVIKITPRVSIHEHLKLGSIIFHKQELTQRGFVTHGLSPLVERLE